MVSIWESGFLLQIVVQYTTLHFHIKVGDFGFINENIEVCQINLDDMDYIAFMGV
jgi:hypothetical protein